MITQEELKELLHYDPDTGIFTWRKSRSRLAHKGDVAGCAQSSKGAKHIFIRINGVAISASRLAYLYMDGVLPSKDFIVQHLDRDGMDNKFKNLRVIKRALLPRINCGTGITGVYLYKSKSIWGATININGKSEYLGKYKTIFDAACARKSAEIKYGVTS